MVMVSVRRGGQSSQLDRFSLMSVSSLIVCLTKDTH
jgi:hypothetical protein